MPTADDLLGLGMPSSLASELGNQPSNLTCAGTSQATAATALTRNVVLTAGASATGVIIPPRAKIGSPWYFSNPGATGALVYAPASTAAVGATTLNGAASTVPLTLAQNKSAILFQTKAGVWVSIPSP